MKEHTFVGRKRCLRPKCNNYAQAGKRGLCGTCYNAACESKRPWADLISEGKALPKRETAKEWFSETK